jgi:hypothetical protein
MAIGTYFDTKRDNQLIASGNYFWCEACLKARPLDDQSPDPRYCLGCYEFLLKEAILLPPKQGRPKWVPKAKEAVKSGAGISGYPPRIMATVKGKKSEVAIIPPSVSTRPIVKRIRRGPKHRTDLPVEVIMQWAGEGMGSKKITAKLKADYDIAIGFRTVARILAGQRVLV